PDPRKAKAGDACDVGDACRSGICVDGVCVDPCTDGACPDGYTCKPNGDAQVCVANAAPTDSQEQPSTGSKSGSCAIGTTAGQGSLLFAAMLVIAARTARRRR